MTKQIIKSERAHGDVALCNLSSVNLVEWFYADKETQYQITQTAVDSLDLAIEYGICPVAEGQITNDEFRYMGIGITNLANLLAKEKITIDTQEAAEFQDALMDEFCYQIYYASMQRAKQFGKFLQFEETKWAEGITPVHLSLEHFPQAWELTEYGRNFVQSGKLERWNELGKQIQQHGIRNAQCLAIAPTANSGKAINATEGAEPILHLVYKEEGVKNIPALAPNIQENHTYYKPAFECNQKNLILNAIVRQKYIDQAQSITMYVKRPDSLKEMTDLHMFAFDNGVKSLYYFKQAKQNPNEIKDECVACAV